MRGVDRRIVRVVVKKRTPYKDFRCDRLIVPVKTKRCWSIRRKDTAEVVQYMHRPRRSAVCALGVQIVDRWMFGLIEPFIHLSSTWIDPCAIALTCKASLPS